MYDTLSLDELDTFYDFFNQKLLKIGIVSGRNDNITFLKICNNMIKRLSKGTFNELRGKVQLLLASLNSLHNKSGLNKKSVINNTSFEAYTEEEPSEQEVVPPMIRQIYDSFWDNIAYLSNPFLLLEPDMGKPGQTPSIPATVASRKAKLLEVLKSYHPLLTYFKNNPIEEEQPVIRRYPKHLKSLPLFLYQLNEPFFRKSVLVQLKYLLFNLDHPLRLCQGNSGGDIRFEAFSEAEGKEVKALDEVVSYLLRGFRPFGSKKHLQDIISRLLSSEKEWIKWKDESCYNYSKSLSEDHLALFKTLVDLSCETQDIPTSDQKLVNLDHVQMAIDDKGKDIRRWLDLEDQSTHLTFLNPSYLAIPEDRYRSPLKNFLEQLLDIDSRKSPSESKQEISQRNKNDVDISKKRHLPGR